MAERLGPIQGVLHVVPDLAAIERFYGGVLGHGTVERGRLDEATAASWSAPAMAGHPWIALEPASREPVRLVFLEAEHAAGYRALITHGWNATEIVVQEVDRLAERLAATEGVRIIGAPKSLTRFPMIRAMQVIGPAGECLYFTQVGPGHGLDLADARSPVGRVFIVVAGAPDLDALFAPYHAFDNAIDPPVATPVGVISAANALPADTLHAHGLVKLGGGTLVELDAYPSVTAPRQAPEGALPPGMALVALAASGIPAGLTPLGPPAETPLAPGRLCTTVRGAGGAHLSLVMGDLA